jgi:hypothetical protein
MASDKSHFTDREIIVNALPISRIPEASSSGGLNSETRDKMEEPETARLKFTEPF